MCRVTDLSGHRSDLDRVPVIETPCSRRFLETKGRMVEHELLLCEPLREKIRYGLRRTSSSNGDRQGEFLLASDEDDHLANERDHTVDHGLIIDHS